MQRDTQATHRESQVVEIRPEDITLEEEIGFGSFAKVYRGKCRGQMVAIKVLKTQTFTEDTLQAFREEVAVMSQIHHPNLVLFMGACTIPGKLMIVTELMPRNLESVFLSDKKPDKKRITLVQKLKMAKDAALGMNWLHKSTPMFIHRDLKLANLLVDENYNVKVCDFGLAKMKQANERLTADKKGSPLYMAPEVFSGSYSEKCDIYSFGLSFWEIINERRVFPRYENNLAALIKSRCGPSHETPPITEGMLPRLVALLQRCWNQNPTQRPSFDVVVKELEEIIIEQCISDEKGRDVWKKASKGEDKMLWDDFARAVCISVSKIGLPESYRSDRQIQCLKVLLCRQSEPNTVYAEKFGKVLSWFGPYLDQREEPHLRCRSFLDRIEETLSQKWFHGELSTQDAEERLGSRQKGTYLVRFSSAQGAFTVSGIDRSGNKCHLRVNYRPHRGEYVLPDGSKCETLTEAVNELCRRNKMRIPCAGSRYAKYFAEGQEPQPMSKNINLVKEEIKQMQLVHLMEIVDVTEEDSSVNTTLDTAHRLMSTNPYNSVGLSSGNLSSVAFNSRGAFGGRGPAPFSQASPDALRIAPFIPPAASPGMSFGLTSPSASPRFPSSSSSSTTVGGSGHRPNPAALAASKAATAVAAARAYHQSPYTHTSSAGGPKPSSSSGNGGAGGGGGSGTNSAKFLNPPDLYYSAPMAGVKNNSGSVFPHSQFASPKHAFTKDVLTAPLKSQQDTKKRGLFSRLKRGVTGKDKDKDRDAHDGGSNSGGLDNGGGGGFDRDNSDSYDLSQTFAWGPGKSGKLSTKSGKRSTSSKRDKRVNNNNNNGGARRGRREGDDSPDYPQYFSGSSDSDSPGHDWPRTCVYLPPMLPSESTSASTNSIPAHVLCSLQKSEDQRVRRMLAGRYDSDSSTEDLFPPYVPSPSALAALTAAGTTVPASVAAAAAPPTSASSAFVKRGPHTDERGRLGHRRPARDDDNESEESEDEDGESEAEYGESEEDSGSEESDEEQLEKQKTKRKGTTTTTTSKSPTSTPAAAPRLKAKESSRALKDDKAARRRRRVEESDDDEVDDDEVEEPVEDEQQKKRKTRKSEKGKERRKAAVKDVETDRRAAGKLARGAVPAAVGAPSAAGGREMSLASTAPPGFFDSALFNPDRKAESRHARRAVNGINGVSNHANGGGSSSSKRAEPEGVRLDQLVLPASSPLLPPPAEEDDDDQEEEKKEEKKKKKRTTTRSKEDSGGDEGETTTMKTGSAPGKTTTKEKKSKKEKSSGKRGGSVVLAASTPDNNNGANSGSSRSEAAPLQRRSLASASASASSDLTGGEEDEMSEKEQNDPQGKKKKKDEERTVIAVF